MSQNENDQNPGKQLQASGRSAAFAWLLLVVLVGLVIAAGFALKG